MDFYDSNKKDNKRSSKGEGRSFLGINFECCGIYSRIYKHHSGKYYAGNCPKCGKPVKILIGKGGTGSRFFDVK
jgi:hypothetical protein